MAYSLPEHLKAENIPPIPDSLIQRALPYFQYYHPSFACWLPQGGMLVYHLNQGIQQVFHLAGKDERLQLLPTGSETVETVVPLSGKHAGFLFTQCQEGNESYQIYFYETETKKIRLITPGMGRCLNPICSSTSDKLAYVSNYPDGKRSKVFVQSIDSQPPTESLTPENNWWTMDWSPDGQFLLLQKCISNTKSYPYILNTNSGYLKPLYPQIDQDMLFYKGKWAPDGKGIFHISILYSEFLQLIYTDLESGEDEILSGEITWDVEAFALSSCGEFLAYIVNEHSYSQLYILSISGRELLSVPELPVTSIDKLEFHPSELLLAIELAYPSSILVWNLKEKTLDNWSKSFSQQNYSPANTQLIHFPSFDQRMIPAFYYPGSGKNSPVIIDIHGGPVGQARPVLSKLFQFWQKEFGLAIIAPNIRGSSGYGKSYMALDDGFLREDAVRDIGALLDWIATQDELNKEKVCVFGGSYGGYMVLASMVHYSDKLALGIDLMGISNFVTYLENTASYRRDSSRAEYGDERDSQMRQFLERISPLSQAHKITKPMYIVHGQNDPRVPFEEASQIVKSLKSNNIEVWYSLFLDEGHGLSKKENGDFFVYSSTLFLEQYLMGFGLTI